MGADPLKLANPSKLTKLKAKNLKEKKALDKLDSVKFPIIASWKVEHSLLVGILSYN